METRFNFTKQKLDALPLPEASQRVVYHDAGGRDSVAGLQLRMTANGVKTFSVFKRGAGGKPERVTLGRYPDLSIEMARREAKKVIAQLAMKESPNAAKRAQRVREQTLAEAVEAYFTEKKTRSGKPLKPRTVADYRRMVAPGKPKADGTLGAPGELFVLAGKPINTITANDMRTVYKAVEKRGSRRAAYAIVVLRAVLTCFDIVVPDDPTKKKRGTSGSITLPKHEGKPHPIPKEYLGDWWNAACRAGSGEVGGSQAAGDYYRFRLLTGCRGVEVLGDDYGNEPIRVRDVDVKGARITLTDTKNRRNHTLLLSTQALDIVCRNLGGKAADDLLFPVADPRKTLQAINITAGMKPLDCQGHDLRDTFATIANKVVVGAYTTKHMLNHKIGDITGGTYTEIDDDDLRNGWQAVADYVEAQAAIAAGANVVQLPEAAA